MIEKKPMEINDFLTIMAANAEVYPEFAELPDGQKRHLANINILTGTAESYIEDGKLVGVGGIRYVGIGEGWFITLPELRQKNRQGLALFKFIEKAFVKTRDELNLWRVFAGSKISTHFLERLGFAKDTSTRVWTRQK